MYHITRTGYCDQWFISFDDVLTHIRKTHGGIKQASFHNWPYILTMADGTVVTIERLDCGEKVKIAKICCNLPERLYSDEHGHCD